MTGRFDAMESCIRCGGENDEASFQEMLKCLSDPEWRIRYTAVIALGDRRDEKAVDPLLQVLKDEDAAPLFSQSGDLAGGPAGSNAEMSTSGLDGIDRATLSAWARRGRIKQAAALALGSIGNNRHDVLAVLQHYAVDGTQDYEVRAAACHALGEIPHESSRGVLEQASRDAEFCTRTEAMKALSIIAQLAAS